MINSVKAVSEDKPVASGGGVNVNISLTEPVLFLRGFEQAENAERSTAMLRGSLILKIAKPVKLEAISLKFRGRLSPSGQRVSFASTVATIWLTPFRYSS